MLNYSANGPSGYNLTNSLRFRASNSAWLNRTFTSAGNRKIWTFSAWVKRGQLGTAQMILCGYSGSSTELTNLQFNSNDTIEYYYDNGAVNYRFTTTQVFRDPSAWYHIVLAVDTTQATNSNRVKFYINGSQVTAFSQYDTFPQNSDTYVNGAWNHAIFRYIYPGQTRFVDGYLTEVNFVNAQQLTPSSFGSTNPVTGVWQPAKYTGTYGTNGFYLNFTDIALTSGSNTGLGKDFSGNGNFFNTNNISVTSGVTYDAMTDVPTLTSATVANYCTLNPLMTTASNPTYSNGNLQAVTPLSGGGNAYGTIQLPSSGKYYWEAQCTSSPTYFVRFGVSAYSPAETFFYNNATSLSYDSISGNKVLNTVNTAYGSAWNANQIIGIAVDLDSGTVTFYNNGVSQGAITYNAAGLFPAFCDADNVSATYTNVVNFGQRPFSYTPPTGYVALNTYNLPTSTIVKGNTVMDATLATGNNSTQVITNAAGFRPDFVWLKIRSASENHIAYDSVRGAQQYLVPNLTLAEATLSSGLTSFNSNGFTLGNANPNYAGSPTFVAWQWQAGQGTNTTNTAGSITSTVSVNASAGFSIVTYTGTGSSGTVGHGLGVTPSMIIVKQRSTTGGWFVNHSALSATQNLYLQATDAVQSDNVYASRSSTTFGITGSSGINASGVTFVAYCWAEIAGFSKFGSYTGNGSADGTFVFTGFMPKYVMIKQTNTTGDWQIFDTSRSPTNVASNTLYANGSFAEDSNVTNRSVDFLSNGFKIRSSGTFINASGGTFIYMAFAESPFKNSLAR